MPEHATNSPHIKLATHFSQSANAQTIIASVHFWADKTVTVNEGNNGATLLEGKQVNNLYSINVPMTGHNAGTRARRQELMRRAGDTVAIAVMSIVLQARAPTPRVLPSHHHKIVVASNMRLVAAARHERYRQCANTPFA